MVLSLAIRNMYQSRVGKLLMREGFFSRLKSMSVAKGKYMDSPESVKVRRRGVFYFGGENKGGPRLGFCVRGFLRRGGRFLGGWLRTV